MGGSNVKLNTEICELIEKYDLLTELPDEIGKNDDFFNELENLIKNDKQRSFNNINRQIRKRKLKKINNGDN